jgi:hypothetical protein
VRTSLVAFVAAGLLALAGPAARAESWHARDARRDVATFTQSPEPPPCGTHTLGTDPTDELRDVAGLRVRHDADTITVRVTMRELRRRGANLSWDLHLLVPAGAFSVDVNRSQGRTKLFTFLGKEPHFSPPDGCGDAAGTAVGRSCEGLSAAIDPRHAALEVSLPRECLHEPRWVRVGVGVLGGFAGTSDAFTLHSDEWTPAGVEDAGYPPPYGPRVRRG